MSDDTQQVRNSLGSHARTLWLVGMLHTFTHLYNVALMPLYLPIQRDFGLKSVAPATLLVTIMMFAYYGPSYYLGVLADRHSRKNLLSLGLLINAIGYIGLSQAPNYATAVVCVVAIGLGGCFYHPAATALVAKLCPGSAGRALGLVGIGASAGFFLGPLYAGWRAEASGWRAPILELGFAGLIGTAVFHLLSEDSGSEQAGVKAAQPGTTRQPMVQPGLWWWFLGAAVCFSLRDFAGTFMASLSSLFLQSAHGMNLRHTGFLLSTLYLASAISNPLFGHFSDRARKRWISLTVGLAAVMMFLLPHVAASMVVWVLLIYGFFFLASYPMVEAELMTSVSDAVRGRVFGFFITIGGLVGNISHWLAGLSIRSLGERATKPESYHGLYAIIAVLALLSLLGLPCLQALRKRT